jgi:hypothetical protein
LSGSLKRFLFINLGEAEEQQCQLFEAEGRVLALHGASLRFIKKRFGTGEKGLGNNLLINHIYTQPVYKATAF